MRKWRCHSLLSFDVLLSAVLAVQSCYCASTCAVHVTQPITYYAVWLLHNLTLDGKLCLRDDKNAAFV